MAEEVLKKLEEQLNCSICLDTYTDPKLLQCFHVYCRQCLVPLGVRDQHGQLSLTCPACRQVTPIPDRGVAGLKPAFHINNLLEIYKDSVKKLDNPAATPEGAVGGTKVDTPTRNMAEYCFEHAEEELKLYCETCGVLVCYQCVIQGGKHHDHDYALLKVAFEKYKEEITSSLEPIEKQVVIIEKALAELDTRCGEISNRRAAIEDSIHVTFKRLREVLTVRETELIDQLHQMTQVKLKGLAAQSDQIETALAKLNSCLHFMRESLRISNKNDVLMMKDSTVQQVKELTTPFQQDMLKPNTEADMIFSALADMTAMCQDYGQLISPGTLNPSNCHATGKGLEAAIVGKMSAVLLLAINYGGKLYGETIKSLECELESKITCTRTSCSIANIGQSQYEINYQPTIKGRHHLHIKVEGQHVRGSPFSLAVKSPGETLKLGTPILTIGGVENPWGVAVNQSGEVVVSETGRDCVSVFSPSGANLRSLGHGQFNNIHGVAVDGTGNILVADYENHRIQKFTAEGQFLAAVGTNGDGPQQFVNPMDILCSGNKVFVAEYINHRIQVLNSDLTFSSTFGKEGSGKGQFKFPQGIACDSTGNVYVADRDNHRIQVFTAEGKFLRMFGRRGQSKGELNRPIGIAVHDGLLYVGEGGNGRVSVFTLEGQFVTSFGSKGTGPGQFQWPCGLAVDNSGVVYVCDYQNNNVQAF